MASEGVLEGGCLCGEVRYRVSDVRSDPAFCHCSSCRRASGAPVVAWFTVPRESFVLVKGEPVEYRSSPPVVRTFCGRCGTALTYRHSRYPDALDVTTTTLDDPAAVPPVDHVWVSDRIPWMKLADGLPTHPGFRPKPGAS
jgi:hypothetical protein